jgi:NADH:ubiquinone oxidoreductase subunit 6 (subunit J)
MSAQDAFWNWLMPWIVIGLGLLTAIVVAIIIALVRPKRRGAD